MRDPGNDNIDNYLRYGIQAFGSASYTAIFKNNTCSGSPLMLKFHLKEGDILLYLSSTWDISKVAEDHQARTLGVNLNHYSKSTTPIGYGHDLLLDDETNRSYRKKNHKSYNQGLPGIGKVKKGFKYPFKVRGEVLFGVYPVLCAMEQGRRDIHRLHIKESLFNEPGEGIRTILHKSQELGTILKPVTKSTLDSLSQQRPHQGVCLEVGKLDYLREIKDLQPAEKLIVYIDSVQDPMNFGSLVRSCYYFGVNRIIASKECCHLSPVVAKASSGVSEIEPIYQLPDISFIRQLKMDGWIVVGTSTSAKNSENIAEIRHKLRAIDKILLILGNEGYGISSSLLNECDLFVKINSGKVLNQHVDSLNVSVATGILLYQLTNL
ncbi:DgyrCDS9309 [Dimorphilus gyrociliatus]|uniref:rRNA methyltransferase 1, mitochondrial n=1 Tax=Dimorphilus gyrociliatus TaxID=2664684 RepID=A0A7I8VWM6_9ANNE|nr:DgyrCDS9309 [Dimorphilus gyrociliatus]